MIAGFENLTLYEILDISPTVVPKEIQEGYYRMRAAFGKDALASYSLYTDEEREEILRLIEEAYHTLIDEQSREEYNKKLSEERSRQGKAARLVQESLPFETPPAVTAPPEAPAKPLAEEEVEELVGPEACPRAEEDAEEIEAKEPPSAGPESEPAPEPVEDVEELEQERPMKWESDEPDIGVWRGAAGEVVGPEPEEPRKEESEKAVDKKEAAEEEVAQPLETSEAPAKDVHLRPEPEDTEEVEIPRRYPATAERRTPSRPRDEETIEAPVPRPRVPAPSAGRQSADLPGWREGARPAAGRRDEFEDTAMDVKQEGRSRTALDYLESGVSGDFLSARREDLGISLEDVWEVTRIRKPILRAIEEEDYRNLPADVFLRGMLLIYARFLDIQEPEAIVKGYMERLVMNRDYMD